MENTQKDEPVATSGLATPLQKQYQQMWANILPQMDGMRKQGELCDLTLRVQSNFGTPFSVHKLLLVCTSRYFKTLHEMNMLGSDLYFPDLSHAGLKAILDFVYGNGLQITEANLAKVEAAAERLLVDTAITTCKLYRAEINKVKQKVPVQVKSILPKPSLVPVQVLPAPVTTVDTKSVVPQGPTQVKHVSSAKTTVPALVASSSLTMPAKGLIPIKPTVAQSANKLNTFIITAPRGSLQTNNKAVTLLTNQQRMLPNMNSNADLKKAIVIGSNGNLKVPMLTNATQNQNKASLINSAVNSPQNPGKEQSAAKTQKDVNSAKGLGFTDLSSLAETNNAKSVRVTTTTDDAGTVTAFIKQEPPMDEYLAASNSISVPSLVRPDGEDVKTEPEDAAMDWNDIKPTPEELEAALNPSSIEDKIDVESSPEKDINMNSKVGNKQQKQVLVMPQVSQNNSNQSSAYNMVVLANPNKIHNNSYPKAVPMKTFYKMEQELVKPYKCHICYKGFVYKSSLARHNTNVHFCFKTESASRILRRFRQHKSGSCKKGKHGCSKCALRFESKSQLYRHDKIAHSVLSSVNQYHKRRQSQDNNRSLRMALRSRTRKIYCKKCLKSFSKQSELILHRALEHKSGTKFTSHRYCTACRTMFEHHEVYVHHMLKRHKKVVYVCQFAGCDYEALSSNSMLNHVKSMHKVQYKCPSICGFTTKSYFFYKRHLKLSHHDGGKCEVMGCKFKAQNEIHLVRHMQTAHYIRGEGRAFPRAGGGGKIQYNACVDKDYQLDSNDESVQCRICDKKLKSEKYMARHYQVWHSDESNIFGCTKHCLKVFRTLAALRKHEKVCGKEKHLGCEQCQYRTNDEAALTNHLFCKHGVHFPGKEIYTCEVCGYETIVKAILRKHMTVHKTVKDFQCKICKMEFRLNYQLKTHMAVHSDEMPYVCNLCEFKTKTSRRLRQHIRIKHTDVDAKPFKCPYCDHRSNLRGNCMKHVRRTHADVPAQVIKMFYIKE